MVLGLAGGFVVFIFTAVALSGGGGGFRAASISFTAGVALLAGFISWTLVLLYHSVPDSAARVAAPFLAFLTWVLSSLLIAGITRQGLQFLMVQIALLGALLLAATARRVVGHHLDVVVARCFRFTASVLVGSVLLGATGITNLGGARPSAIVALIGLGWFLAEYRSGNRGSFWWSLAVLVGIAISLSRSALFAAFVVVAATLFLTSRRNRVRSAILVVLLVGTGYWAITYWAPLRERFTGGDVSLSVAGVNVNAEGRTRIWGVLWSEAQDAVLIGHGTGAASARSLSLSPAFGHPHNDYLRILYDLGVVGLGLFAWFSIRAARLLRHIRKRSGDSTPALAALNAGAAVLIVMATDNPLDYAFVMIPLGALIGLGLGSASPQPRAMDATRATRALRASTLDAAAGPGRPRRPSDTPAPLDPRDAPN